MISWFLQNTAVESIVMSSIQRQNHGNKQDLEGDAMKIPDSINAWPWKKGQTLRCCSPPLPWNWNAVGHKVVLQKTPYFSLPSSGLQQPDWARVMACELAWCRLRAWPKTSWIETIQFHLSFSHADRKVSQLWPYATDTEWSEPQLEGLLDPWMIL